MLPRCFPVAIWQGAEFKKCGLNGHNSVIWEAIDAVEGTDYDQQVEAQTTSQDQPTRT